MKSTPDKTVLSAEKSTTETSGSRTVTYGGFKNRIQYDYYNNHGQQEGKRSPLRHALLFAGCILMVAIFILVGILICSMMLRDAKKLPAVIPSSHSPANSEAADSSTAPRLSSLADNSELDSDISRYLFKRLGMVITSVSREATSTYTIPQGAEIHEDITGKLREGDIITAVNGVSVRNIDDVNDQLTKIADFTTIPFEIYRDGYYLLLDIMLDEVYYGVYPYDETTA